MINKGVHFIWLDCFYWFQKANYLEYMLLSQTILPQVFLPVTKS